MDIGGRLWGLTEAFFDWPPSLIRALRVVVVWLASVEWSPRFCSSSTSLHTSASHQGRGQIDPQVVLGARSAELVMELNNGMLTACSSWSKCPAPSERSCRLLAE